MVDLVIFMSQILIGLFLDMMVVECGVVQNMFDVYCCDFEDVVVWLVVWGIELDRVQMIDLECYLVDLWVDGLLLVMVVRCLLVFKCYFWFFLFEGLRVDDFSYMLIGLKQG